MTSIVQSSFKCAKYNATVRRLHKKWQNIHTHARRALKNTAFFSIITGLLDLLKCKLAVYDLFV